jgi:hypothetical protein
MGFNTKPSITAYITAEVEAAKEEIEGLIETMGQTAGRHEFILTERKNDDANNFESMLESIMNSKIYIWNASEGTTYGWEWSAVESTYTVAIWFEVDE